MTPVACRYCGRPIVWGVDENGTRHPIDPRPPVFEATGVTADSFTVRRVPAIGAGGPADGTFGFGVSHYATCPGASRASADARARRSGAGSAPGGRVIPGAPKPPPKPR